MEVRRIIEDLRDEGVSVFLNSHLLSEVEQVCDRVAFVKQGRVLRQGSMRELMGGVIPVDVRVSHLPPGLLDTLARLGRIERTDTQNPAHADLELWLDREEDIPAIAQAVLGSGAQLYALTPRRADLETLFLELVGGSGDAAQVQEAAHA